MEEIYDTRYKLGRICKIIEIDKLFIRTTLLSMDGFNSLSTGQDGDGVIRDNGTNSYAILLPGQPFHDGTLDVIFKRQP